MNSDETHRRNLLVTNTNTSHPYWCVRLIRELKPLHKNSVCTTEGAKIYKAVTHKHSAPVNGDLWFPLLQYISTHKHSQKSLLIRFAHRFIVCKRCHMHYRKYFTTVAISIIKLFFDWVSVKCFSNIKIIHNENKIKTFFVHFEGINGMAAIEIFNSPHSSFLSHLRLT